MNHPPNPYNTPTGPPAAPPTQPHTGPPRSPQARRRARRRAGPSAVAPGDWLHVLAPVAYLLFASLTWVDLSGYTVGGYVAPTITGFTFGGVILAAVLLAGSAAWAILPAFHTRPALPARQSRSGPVARYAVTLACVVPAAVLTLAAVWEVWWSATPEWPVYGCLIVAAVALLLAVGQHRADVHLRLTRRTNHELADLIGRAVHEPPEARGRRSDGGGQSW